ncbi:hypothetical protein ACQP1U_11590 [Actinomycetota bacterium]
MKYVILAVLVFLLIAAVSRALDGKRREQERRRLEADLESHRRGREGR